MTFFLLSAAPNTKELDVYIKRNQESGFGFRVLGGEGPDQPVGNSSAPPFTTRLDVRITRWQIKHGVVKTSVERTPRKKNLLHRYGALRACTVVSLPIMPL